MDSLLAPFTKIPSELIIHYYCNEDVSNSCKKIGGHISICQRKIFDIHSTNDDSRVIKLRKKISGFIGMRELIMDQMIIQADHNNHHS